MFQFEAYFTKVVLEPLCLEKPKKAHMHQQLLRKLYQRTKLDNIPPLISIPRRWHWFTSLDQPEKPVFNWQENVKYLIEEIGNKSEDSRNDSVQKIVVRGCNDGDQDE